MKKTIGWTILIAGAAICSAVAIVMGVSLALFTDSENGGIGGEAGTVGVTLEEIFDSSGGAFGTETESKTFWGVCSGNKRAVVRAKIVTGVQWYDASAGEPEEEAAWKPAAVPSDAVQYTVNAPNWVKDGEWWYFINVLAPPDGETDKVYVNDVQLTGRIADDYLDRDLRFVMEVVLESAQATHEAYKLKFGTDITETLLAKLNWNA